MNFSLFDFLTLIGSLGFFIYGMKIMSEGIQKAAGNKLREILGAMTRNRFLGFLTGTGITALVQSSSATTVMTVSFVNAGLLTLVESAGVMMGANLGTTATAWLISELGFKVNIAALSLPIIAIGLPFMFSRRDKFKSTAEFLIGFALLFMGLDLLKSSVPNLSEHPDILSFLAGFTEMGVLSRLIFVGIGTLATIILQSSSATMALTLVMCYKGWIPFDAAAAMVLGENIGTTITAEIASLVGNVHAKRSARIHSLFNIIGVSWMIFLMPFYLNGIDSFLTVQRGLESPFTSPAAMVTALALFHTAFNASNVAIMIWFAPQLVDLAKRTVSSKGDFDEEFHLEYIGFGPSSTSEISIVEAKREILKFTGHVKKMTSMMGSLITETDNKKFDKSIKKIEKYENHADHLELEVSDYLSKVSEGELSEKSSQEISRMIGIVGDLEHIADINYQLSKVLERKKEGKIWFTPEQRQNIQEMLQLVAKAQDNMENHLKEQAGNAGIYKNGVELEKEINLLRDNLRKGYLTDLGKGTYTVQSGIIYSDVFSSLEKIGDYIDNINEALVPEHMHIKA